MSILRNMTIKHKLITIVMAACTTGLVLAGVAFLGWEQNSLRDSMVKVLLTRVEVNAEYCKAALAFQDNKDAENMLQALHVDSSITFGGIYDDKNELFAAYYRDDSNKVKMLPPMFKETGFSFIDDFLVVCAPIILDGRIIGTICMQSDLEVMRTTLNRGAEIISAVILISLVAVLLVSTWLQKVISGPILNLAEIAKTVSEEKNYSTRALKQSNDEVGSLIDAFNEMLEQIQQRDSELLEAKGGLEVKVQERTAELSNANERLTMEIAERKKAEKEMEKLNHELEEANNELKNFVYIASHDLREPLRKISAFGGMLQKSLKGKIVDDDVENLGFMIDGSNRMMKMIEGLLVYSRVSTKAQAAETVDLNEIVKQLQQLELAVVMEEKHVEIEIPQPLPAVSADPVQIRQLMQNLIANGIKYQKKGDTPHIAITSKPAADGMVRIEITDNGIGIAPEYHQSIFGMFKRLHSRDEYEGTGIGLAVCKKIVERQDGKIGVESVPDKGSTFWFTVPVVPVSVAATA